jgi:ATP-dependent DNA helicase DinG
VHGQYEYAINKLGAQKFRTSIHPSPFNYRENLLIYLPEGVPEPTEAALYQERAINELVGLSEWVTGGTFVLCTSFKMVDALYEAFCQAVPVNRFSDANPATRKKTGSRRKGEHLLALRQGDASREVLLDMFRKAGNSILFGASTFWQGVDVPGKALEHVVITRLPFQVPDDPVLEARISRCKRHGGNAFNMIQVPHAVIQFRQGIGRLIRSHQDRGVVTILDPRIRTKSYGKTFLDSIPEGEITTSCDRVRTFLEHSNK